MNETLELVTQGSATAPPPGLLTGQSPASRAPGAPPTHAPLDSLQLRRNPGTLDYRGASVRVRML